jgi:general secretion pathway protein G
VGEGGAGFTLLELVVVIAVVGILAAALTPAVIQQVVDARIEETREELAALHAGMVGNPGQSDFGFVGHVGRLPSSLQELVTPGAIPGYTTGTARAIGMGWRGPYVNIGASPTDFLLDGFGRPYVLADGRVRSAGPDGLANTADDLVYPPSAPRIGGDVNVTLRRTQGNRVLVDPLGYRVDLYYPSDGRQEVLSDYEAPFSFTNVPVGPRAIHVVKIGNPNDGEIVGEDTVVVRPGSTMAAELWF